MREMSFTLRIQAEVFFLAQRKQLRNSCQLFTALHKHPPQKKAHACTFSRTSAFKSRNRLCEEEPVPTAAKTATQAGAPFGAPQRLAIEVAPGTASTTQC